MRSSQSPLSGLLSSPAPRRSGSGSRTLGRILGTLGIIFVIMLAIGFGVDQQAKHHIASPTTSTSQHA